MDIKDKKWRNRDWLWVTVILIAIISLISSIRLSNDESIVNIISIGTGIISIILGVMSIIYSMIQNMQTSILNNQMTSKLEVITERVANVDSALKNNIKKNSILTSDEVSLEKNSIIFNYVIKHYAIKSVKPTEDNFGEDIKNKCEEYGIDKYLKFYKLKLIEEMLTNNKRKDNYFNIYSVLIVFENDAQLNNKILQKALEELVADTFQIYESIEGTLSI